MVILRLEGTTSKAVIPLIWGLGKLLQEVTFELGREWKVSVSPREELPQRAMEPLQK